MTALATAAAGGWTIVASVAFSHPTVQHLALASSLAFSGLALVGLTAHELSNERCAHWFEVNAAEPEPDVAAA